MLTGVTVMLVGIAAGATGMSVICFCIVIVLSLKVFITMLVTEYK
jgi:uncharacterized membrane protein YtjA (UPF0391 family)